MIPYDHVSLPSLCQGTQNAILKLMEQIEHGIVLCHCIGHHKYRASDKTLHLECSGPYCRIEKITDCRGNVWFDRQKHQEIMPEVADYRIESQSLSLRFGVDKVPYEAA